MKFQIRKTDMTRFGPKTMERFSSEQRQGVLLLCDATGKILIIFDDPIRENRVAWDLDEAEAIIADANLGGER